MKTARTALLLLTALGLLVAAPSADAAEPASLTELGERLAKTRQRLAALLEEANRDERELQVEEFLNYGPAERKRKRRIRAEDIVDIMADPTADHILRQRAKEALRKCTMEKDDPDLNAEKKGRGTARGYFYGRHVVKLLAHEDREVRMLTDKLLYEVWGRVLTDPKISKYNVETEKTWNDAVRGWKDYLKKK